MDDLIHIPVDVVQAAIKHMEEGSPHEIGGLICSHLDGALEYHPGENISDNPRGHVRLAASWYAGLITEGWSPIVYVHSHPGGQDRPSQRDMETFPWMLLQTGMVVYPQPFGELRDSGMTVCRYDGKSWERVKVEEFYAKIPL